MNTKERNSLIDLLSLAKNIDLNNDEIDYYFNDILLQIKMGLEREKEDLNYRIEKINKDLELIEYIKEEIKNFKGV